MNGLCIGFNIILLYAVYYLCILSVWSIIMFYDAKQNSNMLLDDTDILDINIIDMFALVGLLYLMNIVQTLVISLGCTIHFIGVNLAIHKYSYVYLLYFLNNILHTNECKHRYYINCSNYNSTTGRPSLDNTVITYSIEKIQTAIIILVCCEFLSGTLDRCNHYYFYKNIFKDIIASFIIINISALLFIFFIIVVFIQNPDCTNIHGLHPVSRAHNKTQQTNICPTKNDVSIV